MVVQRARWPVVILKTWSAMARIIPSGRLVAQAVAAHNCRDAVGGYTTARDLTGGCWVGFDWIDHEQGWVR